MYLTLEAAAYMSMAALVDLLRPTASPQTIHPPTYRREPDGVVDLLRTTASPHNSIYATCWWRSVLINQRRRGRTALPPPVWRTRVVAAKASPPPIAAATGHGDVLQSLPGEYIYT